MKTSTCIWISSVCCISVSSSFFCESLKYLWLCVQLPACLPLTILVVPFGRCPKLLYGCQIIIRWLFCGFPLLSIHLRVHLFSFGLYACIGVFSLFSFVFCLAADLCVHNVHFKIPVLNATIFVDYNSPLHYRRHQKFSKYLHMCTQLLAIDYTLSKTQMNVHIYFV